MRSSRFLSMTASSRMALETKPSSADSAAEFAEGCSSVSAELASSARLALFAGVSSMAGSEILASAKFSIASATVVS